MHEVHYRGFKTYETFTTVLHILSESTFLRKRPTIGSKLRKQVFLGEVLYSLGPGS